MQRAAVDGAERPSWADAGLYNPDLAPVPQAQRDWSWVNMATVWMGMVHNVVVYEAAAGLMALGLTAWESLAAVAVGYAVLFLAMWFNARAGTRYGLPFCVLIRSAFGPHGGQVPVVLRGFCAIFWVSVQGYAGAQALDAMLAALSPGWAAIGGAVLGMSLRLWLAMALFWALHAWIVSHGVHRIRNFELVAGPAVIAVGACATAWGLHVAHGLGPLFAVPPGHHPASWTTFFVGVTGMIGVWSTFAVNIPDLSRFARSERDQALGQLIGLPITAVVFMAMSVITTSATVIVFGHAIWDPVELLLAFHSKWLLMFGGATIILATLSVNVAANIMPASYDLVNLMPRRLRFGSAATLVLAIAVLFAPWLWFRDAQGIFAVLGALGGLLGPVTGIMLVDFYLIRRQHLSVADLYRYDGIYGARSGWNPAGLIAFVLGGAIASAGYVIPALASLTGFSWFIGIAIGAGTYAVLARRGSALATGPLRVV
ncbi:NCS1 family nucleobase:cation symporter-1 [Endobacter medicaginis]|uniref:NCS1 family nucleobase:cation symporter-1 n=1 Tax=Endobacter medicaginis TaxID=1181271 RepID=A0A850NPD2_9PROT|nr:NCS1 family nucleobase:cation symporter-1 [Endobacter medicaginis]MBB3173529.1 NCS1 family nucleobase:cation symporter-1 [Endobacter medicaginis]MCX5475382.1 NCS1 family nucleobase:cation symporter-1 [Endobacter medicaginis]NVN30229.1 NCS1 family nucleobase:cation symporter-1 [Endobacter medicaginis]